MGKNRNDVSITVDTSRREFTAHADMKWVGLDDSKMNKLMLLLGEPDKQTMTKTATGIVLQHKDGVHDFIARDHCPLCRKAMKKAAKKLARRHAEGKHESLHDEACAACRERDLQEAEQIITALALPVGPNPFHAAG